MLFVFSSTQPNHMNQKLVERRIQSATEERLVGKNTWLIAPGIWRIKDVMVNVYIVQNEEATGWVLVDTGLKSTGKHIIEFVTENFGNAQKPLAIVMTHGHFDHRGSLLQLADAWQVPVYCHKMEEPYLTGQASYPPPDPSVGGGAMTILSFAYPSAPIDASDYIQPLPEDGSIKELPGWHWLHTPGHTPGHVSLFRERDGVLIAGDAVVTTLQESIISVISQAKILSGPPKYFTPDWGAAARSVRELAALEPSVIATGHGHALYGEEARKQLHRLAKNFWQRGIPASGRYVSTAAEFDDDGKPSYVPPPRGKMLKKILAAGAVLALGYIIYKQRKNMSGINKKVTEQLGKSLMSSSLGVLGATAPAAAGLPNLPVIPSL